MNSEEKYIDKIYKLKNVIRYNSRNVISRESVAEHTFNVAMISLLICDKYKTSDEIKLKCLIKALLHDMPETVLNDITHDVKEKLNLRQILKKYEDEYYETEFPQYAKLMIEKEEPVSCIVDLADAISVKQYVDNEIKLGNKSEEILEINDNTHQRIKALMSKVRKEMGE